MPTRPRRLLRHSIALAALPITAVASLAMAASQPGIGAHLVEIWLVGWISLLLLVLPATALLGRLSWPRQTARGPGRDPSDSSNHGQLQS